MPSNKEVSNTYYLHMHSNVVYIQTYDTVGVFGHCLNVADRVVLLPVVRTTSAAPSKHGDEESGRSDDSVALMETHITCVCIVILYKYSTNTHDTWEVFRHRLDVAARVIVSTISTMPPTRVCKCIRVCVCVCVEEREGCRTM